MFLPRYVMVGSGNNSLNVVEDVCSPRSAVQSGDGLCVPTSADTLSTLSGEHLECKADATQFSGNSISCALERPCTPQWGPAKIARLLATSALPPATARGRPEPPAMRALGPNGRWQGPSAGWRPVPMTSIFMQSPLL